MPDLDHQLSNFDSTFKPGFSVVRLQGNDMPFALLQMTAHNLRVICKLMTVIAVE